MSDYVPHGSVCTGSYYSCGETSELQTSSTSATTYTQTRDIVNNLVLGNVTIPIQVEKRTFTMRAEQKWEYPTGIFVVWAEGSYSPCGQQGLTVTGGVSEDFRYTSTVLYFIDSRYNNAIYKTTEEHISFSADASSARYIGDWGAQYFTKYVIENHIREKIVKYCVCINGRERIIATTRKTVTINGKDNPLILVSDMVPKTGRWEDDAILKYDFYDYNDELRQLNDGGTDFYYTDWMRGIGLDYRDVDQTDANNRYSWFYLSMGESTANYNNQSPPEPVISTLPVGSVAVDTTGNVFYSVALPEIESEHNNTYYTDSKLLVGSSEIDIPTDCECDIWFPVSVI